MGGKHEIMNFPLMWVTTLPYVLRFENALCAAIAMTEFLAENNACGQNLLRIVSMGNSIIAEILRLKDYIPSIYRLANKADQQKYGEIILDFCYLKKAEAQEQKIENNQELQELDDEIRTNYLELLTRFYLAFESTHQYAADLHHYVDELNRGYYIQQTLESVLQDEEGKQLMCEALYLFGVILLILDFHIPGVIRERLLVAYYRYSGCVAQRTDDSSIDDVCMLLRSTGYVAQPAANAPINSKSNALPNYPESFFARYRFDQNFVDMIIGRLRSDDIYNQLTIYPHPNHRSTALSTQASMLYVCLYFSPRILHEQVAQMREIVDKYFNDNWVLSIHMGMTVNLVDAWDQFKAAKTALMSVVDIQTIKGLCLLNREELKNMFRKTKEVLREGVMNDFYVLENINNLVVLMRQTNVLLRWYLLHTTDAVFVISRSCQKVQQLKQLILLELQFAPEGIFKLLLNSSDLELIVKELLRELMEQREQRWEKYKKEASERLTELSISFGESRPLSKIQNNPQLQQWFKELATEIEQQNIDEAQKAGRMLIQIIEALEEVQEYHNLHSNMQVKQFLQETREFLHRMIQIINIKEDLEIRIQMITDFSYAWQILDRDFTLLMQDRVKKSPKVVIRIRATYLKLASALEIPLMRINQAKSEDLESVSNYYSTELAKYMRKVLQIVPESMFNILARIIKMQTEVMKEIPTRLDKDKLNEYVQYDDRFEMAQLTYQIAVFTKGILMMKKTLVGVIELDPKQMLEDGIRQELVRHLANALNVGLIFTPVKGKDPTTELCVKLETLSNVMDGYRRSFEYVDDYLQVHGLKVLQEEFTRIINYNVEKECNVFLRNKVLDWQSQYQSETIPIPTFPPVQGDTSSANNFIGRLAYEILRCTDPKTTTYVDLKATWYDKRAVTKVVIEPQFFSVLREGIIPAGMVGLERLYAYMLADELKRNLDKLHKNLTSDKMWCETLSTLSTELESRDFPKAHDGQPLKFYNNYVTRWQKVWPMLLDWVLSLGHKQLLRQQIANELSITAKCDAKLLENSLDTLNRALLLELKTSKRLYNEAGAKLLTELDEYLRFVGNYEPLEQVFLVTKNTHNLALWLFLFTLAHLPRLQFSRLTHTMQAKTPKDNIDGTPLIMGILTILKQYNTNVKMLYISYLCQFVNVVAEANINDKQVLCPELVTMLNYLQCFTTIAKLPVSVLMHRIPTIILTQFQNLTKLSSK